MPTDYSLELRKAVVVHLKASAPLTALVASARIYGEQPKDKKPDWPFIRYGFPITDQFEATGWDGSQTRVTIHAFASGPYTDSVSAIAAQVVEAMKTLAVPSLSLAENAWRGTQILPEPGEQDDYHAIIEFDIAVVG